MVTTRRKIPNKYVPSENPPPIVTIYHSNGYLKADPITGEIINRLGYTSNQEFDDIVKVDLMEYGEWYGHVSKDIDDVDIGIWFADGRYKSPHPDYRKRPKIIYGDE